MSGEASPHCGDSRRRYRSGSHPGGVDGARGRRLAQRLHLRSRGISLRLRVLREARPHDGGRRVRSPRRVSRHLFRRRRRSVGARPHRRVGADPSAAAAVRSVREPSADAPVSGRELAARESRPRRHRHDLRARELRRRVRRHRRKDSRGHAVRSGGAGGPLHAPRHQPHRALRVRAGVEASAARARERDEVERAAALDGAVGHGGRRSAQGLSGRRVQEIPRRCARRAHGDASADARRHRRVEPVRRHPDGSRRGDFGQPRAGGERQHQSRTEVSVDVRADSRVRARHQRERASPIRSAPSGPAP